MSVQKITGHVKAWASVGWAAQRLNDHIKAGEIDDATAVMTYTNLDMSDNGYIEVGIATITVEFYPREQIVAKQVDGLREQLRQHRIKAHQAEQAILEQISKLQALPLDQDALIAAAGEVA